MTSFLAVDVPYVFVYQSISMLASWGSGLYAGFLSVGVLAAYTEGAAAVHGTARRGRALQMRLGRAATEVLPFT